MQRFLPSEYGCNVELAEQMLEPVRSIFGAKLRVREALRVAGVPHTIIRGNLTQGFLVPRFGNPSDTGLTTILGDGEAQGNGTDNPRTDHLHFMTSSQQQGPNAILQLIIII